MLKEYYHDIVDWNVYSTKDSKLITTIHNCSTLKNLSDDKTEKLLKECGVSYFDFAHLHLETNDDCFSSFGCSTVEDYQKYSNLNDLKRSGDLEFFSAPIYFEKIVKREFRHIDCDFFAVRYVDEDSWNYRIWAIFGNYKDAEQYAIENSCEDMPCKITPEYWGIIEDL